jgi:D-cysteine desulfhydrase/L-cysteate sulfo-lyase
MRCILYLRGDPGEGQLRGNVLMNRLFGAEVNIINTPDYSGPEEAAALRKHDLEREGRRVLIIPLGGADGLGTLAFAQAAEELRDQCQAQGVRPASVFLAAGTGSTAAGLSLGMSLIASPTQVVALSVSRKKKLLLNDMRAQQLLALCAARSERSLDDLATPLLVLDDYVAADLTYTGKALAGMITLIESGFEKGPVVFWHTGGVPELFSRDEDTLHALLSGGRDE